MEDGYARFAELARKLGFAVEGRRLSKFTGGVLGDADILILPLQSFALSDGDVGALRQFIKSGGGVFVLGYNEIMFTNIGHALNNLGTFISGYGIEFAAPSCDAASALVDKASPLSRPYPAAHIRSPNMRRLLDIDASKADAAAVFEDGGIHTAISIHWKTLGLGRLVVCGDMNLPLCDDSNGDVIGKADNTPFLKNILLYLKGGPDLGISMVKFRGKTAYPGSKIVVISRVMNFGNISSGKAKVSVLLVSADSQPAFELDPLKTVRIKALEPGKSRKYKIVAPIPLGVDDGDYFVLVKVEPNGDGEDLDAANNSMASRKSLTIH